MFTGIVREIGTVEAVERDADGARLRVGAGARRRAAARATRSRSSGVCLTVDGGRRRRLRGRRDEPDAVADHARRARGRRPRSTSSPRCGPASRSAGTSSRATSTASARCARVDRGRLRAPGAGRGPRRPRRYVVEHGSVAVDGVSLTVAALGDGRVRGLADPGDARAHDARRPGRGERGQPRGGRGRPLRRAPRARLQTKKDLRWLNPDPQTPPPPDAKRGGGRPRSRPIEEAIEEIRRGRMVVVCDDENRENEGDLTMAAQFATPEAINFMAKHGRGLICLSLTGERCDELGLDLMAAKNESPFNTAFTVSVEAARGRDDRDLGGRPRPHDPGRDRPALEPRRPRPAGPRLPAEGQGRRRARARRPDGGGGRPRAAGGPDPGRRDLRDHERGRDDGPRAGPGAVLRAARPEDDHRRRPDRLPAADRAAGRARGRRRKLPTAFGEFTAVGYRSLRRREAPPRDGQGRRRRVSRTSSSESTPSA